VSPERRRSLDTIEVATVEGMSDGSQVDLATTFSEIARALVAEQDAHATLNRIVQLAVETIDACQHCGVSIVEGRHISSPASSDAVPAIVDRLQSETGEGPCVDAIKDHEVFQTGRLSEETRWPNFAHRASTESGVESILSLRLFVDGGTMGSLNLYSAQPDAFDRARRHVRSGVRGACRGGLVHVPNHRQPENGIADTRSDR
jgi:transcriptional regulator with GAF, ATPase, and Fis domain